MYVVLGLLGLKKKNHTISPDREALGAKKEKNNNPCVCSPRSPWFEKNKKIHVYVVLGLLGFGKKNKKKHVHEVLSPWFEKQYNSCPCVEG